MPDIAEIRTAQDEHLALFTSLLTARANSDDVGRAFVDEKDKADEIRSSAITRADRTRDAAYEKAEGIYSTTVEKGQTKVDQSALVVEEAQKALSTFQERVREEMGIVLPSFEQPVSGGHTRL